MDLGADELGAEEDGAGALGAGALGAGDTLELDGLGDELEPALLLGGDGLDAAAADWLDELGCD